MKQCGRLARACLAAGLGLAALGASAHAGTEVARKATVHDLRTPAQKQARRDSNFSAIYFLADKTVKPDAIGQLQEALGRHLTGNAGNLDVEIRELAVVDFFPHRLRAGPVGIVPNLITRNLMDAQTDWSFVQDMHVPDNQDSVICLASGTVNGAAAKASAYVSYRLNGFAVMVHSNKGFRSAVSECLDHLASKLLAPLGAASGEVDPGAN